MAVHGIVVMLLVGEGAIVGVADFASFEAFHVGTLCGTLDVSSFDDTLSPICNTLDSCARQLITSLCLIIANLAFSFTMRELL
jgi:hypothetical protein